MDILNLETQLKLVSATLGCTLNIEERLQLKLSLMKLKEMQDLDEVLFWGKIRGIVKDYYLALGVNYRGHKEFPLKRFYWATAGYTFAPLPEVRAEFEELAKKQPGYFTGEHGKVLQTAPKLEGAESKDFTELDRLAYVVRKVEHDTHVVPLGAFKFTPIQEIRKNELFAGVTKDDMMKLGVYQHFRAVETADKREQLERNEGVLQTDIFDPLDQDKPKGSWTVQVLSGCVATVKSLLWPGYVFFHMAHTGNYWGVYLGDGLVNSDLPFML